MPSQESNYAFLQYEGVVAMMAGRTREVFDVSNVKTYTDLLKALDAKYPGFFEVFMPPNGIFNSRTGIVLQKPGKPAVAVIDPNAAVEPNDKIILW